ncbi:MAG TPA: extracellular solute-binding protein [Thermoflexales bacterium]|nr:extracellular solute-binding protein [Thermoflexales bacterium]HQZ22531.1 extracellular solute-binding protein [Thermoflexales bacterium]HRA00721.1 extracellular solute-binding protein [Thermoflexales bacterium]
MNFRTIVPFAAAIAMALSACTGAAAPTAAPAKPAEATKAPAPAAAVSNPPKTAAEVDSITLTKEKPTEILFWHRYTGRTFSTVLEIVNDFNAKNPYGISVKLENAGASYDDVFNKVNAAISAGGALPDVVIAYQNQAASYRDLGKAVNLNPFMSSAKYGLSADDQKDYYKSFLDSDNAPQFPGERLGFPTQRSMDSLYVNLDLLKAAGYSAPPKTLKEFEEMACKVKGMKTADGKDISGWIWRNDASNFASIVFANGGDILKADASEYVFNSQAGVDSLALIQRLFKNGCAIQLPAGETNGEQTRFANGQLLFVTSSQAGLPFYADAVEKGAKVKWTITRHPQADPAKPGTNLFGASWSVMKNTPEKELAAWLFMKAFGEKDNTTKFSNISGYFPVRQSAAAGVLEATKANKAFANYPEAAAGFASLFTEALPYGKIEAPVAGYDPVRKLIADTVVAVGVKGEGDPKAALDTAVKSANQILKENAPKSK